MSILIRSAQSSDGPSIWRLLQQFAASYKPDDSTFGSTFPNLISKKDAEFLVAEVDGFVCGYLLAIELPTLFANGSILEITELVVDEPRRGAGIGRSLVDHALELAWTRGCVEVVVPTRRAVGFYEQLGFSRSAEYLKRKRD